MDLEFSETSSEMSLILNSSQFALQKVDPFNNPQLFTKAIFKALAASAFFRGLPIVIFFALWSITVCLLIQHVYNLSMQPTLLTAIGAVLGFVISYRTTSSFERYNGGRQYWSQIILASRTFSQAVWLYVPAMMPSAPGSTLTAEENRARVIFEKKSIINLVEAFAVAVKHYLRGEIGIYYSDLFHLIKHLPSYDLCGGSMSPFYHLRRSFDVSEEEGLAIKRARSTPTSISSQSDTSGISSDIPLISQKLAHASRVSFSTPTLPGMKQDSIRLLPARLPPRCRLLKKFPFSLLRRFRKPANGNLPRSTEEGKEFSEDTVHEMNAKYANHNVPMDISIHLHSYVATLGDRKALDVPRANLLISSLNQLTDALSGLERIITTPIPFSYSIHLWVVTSIYCLSMPFQLWPSLGWVAVLATTICSFIFFGFLLIGEEIENPFGYDKNDLNLDHFTYGIIRKELMAITSRLPHRTEDWVFAESNDRALYAGGSLGSTSTLTPQEWIERGFERMQVALATYHAQNL